MPFVMDQGGTMLREEEELALIAHALEAGNLDRLRGEGIDASYFVSYRDLAEYLFSVPDSLPSRNFVERRFSLSFPPPPDERDIPYICSSLKDRLSADVFAERHSRIRSAYRNKDFDGLIEELSKSIEDLRSIRQTGNIVDIVGEADRRLEHVRRTYEERSLDGGGKCAFGHPYMNDYIGGMFPGDLIVYAARTGVGKSFQCVLDAHASWMRGANVLYASYEMDANQIGFRFDSISSSERSGRGFSIFNLRRGIPVVAPGEPHEKASMATDEHASLYREHISGLIRMRERGEAGGFYVISPSSGSSSLTPSVLKSHCREYGIDLLVVDYLGLVPSDGYYKDLRERLASVSYDLKMLAVELGITVIAPHQLNREAEKADEITVAHFSESDAVGRNCDIAITLERVSRYMIYKIIKMRGGPKGKRFGMEWDFDTSERKPFEDIIPEGEKVYGSDD